MCNERVANNKCAFAQSVTFFNKLSNWRRFATTVHPEKMYNYVLYFRIENTQKRSAFLHPAKVRKMSTRATFSREE